MNLHLNSDKKLSSMRNSLIGISVMLFSVCSGCRDVCKDVVCKNGGTCVDGSCDCADGYSGPDCGTNLSANFIGTYNVSETCPDAVTYTVNISVDTFSITHVKIANFNDSFSNLVTANVNGTTITIPSQAPDNDGRFVSGAGSFIPPNEIDWNYSVTGYSGTVSCSNSVWVK